MGNGRAAGASSIMIDYNYGLMFYSPGISSEILSIYRQRRGTPKVSIAGEHLFDKTSVQVLSDLSSMTMFVEQHDP